jgi:hypothetical protein
MPRQFKTLKTNSSSEVHGKLINSRASIAKCLLEFTRTPITKYTICVRKDFFCIPRLWVDQMDSRNWIKGVLLPDRIEHSDKSMHVSRFLSGPEFPKTNYLQRITKGRVSESSDATWISNAICPRHSIE